MNITREKMNNCSKSYTDGDKDALHLEAIYQLQNSGRYNLPYIQFIEELSELIEVVAEIPDGAETVEDDNITIHLAEELADVIGTSRFVQLAVIIDDDMLKEAGNCYHDGLYADATLQRRITLLLSNAIQRTSKYIRKGGKIRLAEAIVLARAASDIIIKALNVEVGDIDTIAAMKMERLEYRINFEGLR